MKGDEFDTGKALPRGAAHVLSAERVAYPASPPITAEQKAERLARMAALARAIRVDAAKLLSDQTFRSAAHPPRLSLSTGRRPGLLTAQPWTNIAIHNSFPESNWAQGLDDTDQPGVLRTIFVNGCRQPF